MTFFYDFIPLWGAFLGEFSSLFFYPFIALCFIATVPFIIRSICKMR